MKNYIMYSKEGEIQKIIAKNAASALHKVLEKKSGPIEFLEEKVEPSYKSISVAGKHLSWKVKRKAISNKSSKIPVANSLSIETFKEVCNRAFRPRLLLAEIFSNCHIQLWDVSGQEKGFEARLGHYVDTKCDFPISKARFCKKDQYQNLLLAFSVYEKYKKKVKSAQTAHSKEH